MGARLRPEQVCKIDPILQLAFEVLRNTPGTTIVDTCQQLGTLSTADLAL